MIGALLQTGLLLTVVLGFVVSVPGSGDFCGARYVVSPELVLGTWAGLCVLILIRWNKPGLETDRRCV
jgi:hypothetical protein